MKALIILAACCSWAALLPAQSTTPASTGRSYSRLLERAIARAKIEMARKQDIWEDHSTWENAWRAQTEHYEVRMMRSYAWANDIAVGLEHMLGEFQKALGIDFVPAERMKIFVFPDRAAYNQFGEQHGEHHSSFYGSFYAPGHPERPVAACEEANAKLMRMQITHSALHQYLALAFPGSTAPAFVHEGLAAYFTAYWDYGWTLDRLEFYRGRHEYVALEALVTDSIDQYGNYTPQRYTELAMLFYYLLRFRDDTRTSGPDDEVQRAPFRDYLLALLRGEDATVLPAHELTNDLEKLGEDFAAYEFPR